MQTSQTNQLLEDMVRAIARQGELGDKLRKELAGSASEVAKLRDDVASVKQAAEARFRTLASQDARGGLFGAEAQRARAEQLGKFVRALVRRDHAELETLRAGVAPDSGPEGGYLLSEEHALDLMRDVEEAGVFLRNCPPMAVTALSGGTTKPTSGLTLYYPAYGVAATLSTPGFGMTKWDLKRHTVAVELDAWMLASGLEAALGEFIRREFSYTIALGTDTNWFLGDGTSQYCGYTGLFKDGNLPTVDADAGDDTFDEVIAKSTGYLAEMLGKLPLWAHGNDCRWYMHMLIFMKYLGVRDTTGQPIAQVLMAQQLPTFYLFGYPVEPLQIAPTSTATETVFVLLANLKRACRTYRHARAAEFKSSEHVKFLEGIVTAAADVPLDRVVYNVDGAVGLKTAAS